MNKMFVRSLWAVFLVMSFAAEAMNKCTMPTPLFMECLQEQYKAIIAYQINSLDDKNSFFHQASKKLENDEEISLEFLKEEFTGKKNAGVWDLDLEKIKNDEEFLNDLYGALQDGNALLLKIEDTKEKLEKTIQEKLEKQLNGGIKKETKSSWFETAINYFSTESRNGIETLEKNLIAVNENYRKGKKFPNALSNRLKIIANDNNITLKDFKNN